MKIKPGFILRSVGKNLVVLPTGGARLDFNGMISLNTVGAFLWERLQTPQTVVSLLDAMTAKYEVGREQAAADLARFLKTLRDNNLLDDSNVAPEEESGEANG